MLAPALILDAPYIQRAIAELVLLAVLAGVLGSWIVLRRLAFYTHAVGTATFPGLVVAAPWAVAPQLTALVAALGFGAGLERLSRSRRLDPGAATGLLLVAALAAGAILASDVYESPAGVDQLLFGTLIGLSERDVALTAAAVVAALLAHGAMHRAWLATGFDPGSAGALGVRTRARESRAARRRRGGRRRLARRRRRAAGGRRARRARRDRAARGRRRAHAAARHGPARGGRGPDGARDRGRRWTSGPGPVMAVLGGVVFALTAAVRR